MPVTVTCQQCEAPIVVPPSRAKRRRFCSHDCRRRWMSENLRGEAHPMHGKRHRPESIEKMRANAKPKRGTDNPNWKGRYLSRGYVMVSVPGGRAVPEHRTVMEQVLGRPLAPTETVHHINGVKTDNRPENLEVHDVGNHSRLHHEVYRELRALRAENEALRAAQSKCSCGTFPLAG